MEGERKGGKEGATREVYSPYFQLQILYQHMLLLQSIKNSPDTGKSTKNIIAILMGHVAICTTFFKYAYYLT